MDSILAFLTGIDYWYWFIFAGVLLILEVLTGGGFMLWIGISAAVVGVVMVIFPHLFWPYQFLIFAIVAILSCIVWRNHLRKNPIQTDKPHLNRRSQQYLGRIFTLQEPIVDQVGRVHIGDTLWRVSGNDQAAGTKVKVVDVDGVTLKVEKVE